MHWFPADTWESFSAWCNIESVKWPGDKAIDSNQTYDHISNSLLEPWPAKSWLAPRSCMNRQYEHAQSRMNRGGVDHTHK